MIRLKRPGITANKEQSIEKKKLFRWGKGTANTAIKPPPSQVHSEPDTFDDLRPTISQVRTAELFRLFVPLVLFVLLNTYIASATYVLSRATRALGEVRGSAVNNVVNPFDDQIARFSLQTEIQADTVRSLADAFGANSDRTGDNRSRETKSSLTLPPVAGQLGILRVNIAAMRSQIDDLRSMMSEQKARDPYPGTWAKSQDWGIVLFNSSEGYNAKYFYPSVEEFYAAYGSSGDYSIKLISAESQLTRLILTVDRGESILPLPSDAFADPSPGTTERPDAIVGDIVRRFPPSDIQPQCLLIVSGRCPIPSSDQWQKLRVHVCVLDDQNQSDELRRKWQDFCRRHGSGLCEIVPFSMTSKLAVRAAGGKVRGWIESALRSPPPHEPPKQSTSG
ncbi:MAG TPA: hypothetical protein DDZ51_22780 [Planctomycetaceae bacterium]|nr:hypothetical protein [Planctomycetaceae bacterium]